MSDETSNINITPSPPDEIQANDTNNDERTPTPPPPPPNDHTHTAQPTVPQNGCDNNENYNDNNTNDNGPRDVETIKQELKALGEARRAMELGTSAAIAYLQSTPVGLDGRLIDDEGFPRADVDLYAVREARHTLACNKNDLAGMLDAMQRLLEELHEATREATAQKVGEKNLKKKGEHAVTAVVGPTTDTCTNTDADRNEGNNKKASSAPLIANGASAQRPPPPPPPPPPAFLRVANVAANSPAHQAGLRSGDHIHAFGSIDRAAFSSGGLAVLAAHTRANEGQSVVVAVSTPEISTTLIVEHFIVPRRWAGPGLIGAEFDPI